MPQIAAGNIVKLPVRLLFLLPLINRMKIDTPNRKHNNDDADQKIPLSVILLSVVGMLIVFILIISIALIIHFIQSKP